MILVLAVLVVLEAASGAGAAPDSVSLARRAALAAGADSVRVSLRYVERWIREAPPVHTSLEEVRGSTESTNGAEQELLHQLDAPETADRALAIDQVGRRRSVAGLRVLRHRLETGKGPQGEDIGILEAASMIEALGVARDTSAVPALIEYASQQGPYIRAYVYHALGQIGDPRALSLLRPGFFGPCGWSGGVSTMDADIRAVANLGDATDVPQLAQVAQSCVPSRPWALAAIGAIAGTEAAIDTMMVVLGAKPSLTQIFSLSDLGTRMQQMAAERRAVRRDPG
ncbi:MAG TPA: HEAT repeat domain-containing protein [Candidatus Eisenbacteria bacterium]|nr:HEAT repeat domain-containing protein [Candidatus Eisenbacteria bacterium]